MSELETKIKAAVDELTKAILGALRTMTIDDIGALVHRPAPPAPRTATSRAAKPAVARRVTTLTPKAKAALKWQGQYIGLLRKFDDKKKAALKAIVKKSGVPAAVAEMRRLLAAKGK